jgi:hypothetical protein
MKALRMQFEKAVEELWPKWNFVQRTILLTDLESDRLHLHYNNKAELKSVKEALASPPVIRSPVSSQPTQVFFAKPKANSEKVCDKQKTDIPLPQPEIKAVDGTSYVPEERDGSESGKDKDLEHAHLVDALQIENTPKPQNPICTESISD